MLYLPENLLDQPRVFKYLPISRLLSILKNKELSFIYPNLWNDPFEKIYLNADYSSLGYEQPKIFCMCVTTTTDNEEAAWKIYSAPEERIIRCKINFPNLLSLLNRVAEENNYTVYISPISYEFKKYEIQSLYKRTSPYYDDFFQDFSDEKYINILSLKRKAFKYENEQRIFIVPKERIEEDILKIKVPDDILQDIFSTFTIQPYEFENKSTFNSRIKSLKQEIEIKAIKEEIACLYNKEIKVYKSSLYNPHKTNLKIE